MMPISNDTWPAKRALEKLSYFIIKMYKFLRIKTQIGLRGGVVVSTLSVYSVDPSSNPAKANYVCTVNFWKNIEKEAKFGPYLKKSLNFN